MTASDQIARWLAAPEGARLEFKSAASNFHLEKLAEYCVALANEGGGKVILGVTDRRPRTVVGTNAFPEPGRAEATLHEWLRRRVSIEEVQHDGKRLLIVHVPARLPGTAWSYKGRYVRRAGDGLIPIPDSELLQMLAETGPDYSAESSKATLADLAPQALREFRERWLRKSGNSRIREWTDEQLLTNAELLVQGCLNIAALILLGSREALAQLRGFEPADAVST